MPRYQTRTSGVTTRPPSSPPDQPPNPGSEVLGTTVFYEHKTRIVEKLDASGKKIRVPDTIDYTPNWPTMATGGIGEWGIGAGLPIIGGAQPDPNWLKVVRTFYADGRVKEEFYDVDNNKVKTSGYVDEDQAGYFKRGEPVGKSSPIEGVSAPPTQKYIVSRSPTGELEREINPNWEGESVAARGKQHVTVEGRPYTFDPDTGTYTAAAGIEQKPFDQEFYETYGRWPTEEEKSQAIRKGLGYPNPPQAPQRAPQYASEIEVDMAQAAQARANTARIMAELERERMGKYMAQRQDAQIAIDYIYQQMASGEINEQEANRQAGLIRSNLDAFYRGTTIFQEREAQRKAATEAKTRQLDLAGNIFGGRAQQAGSMAQSLLGQLGDTYSQVLSSTNPPYGANPLALGQMFATESYGGQEMANLAKSLLMAALQEQIKMPTEEPVPVQGGF